VHRRSLWKEVKEGDSLGNIKPVCSETGYDHKERNLYFHKTRRLYELSDNLLQKILLIQLLPAYRPTVFSFHSNVSKYVRFLY
jgi:hypothetical protein